MKIIRTDNFARDNVADALVCENVGEYFGKIIVEALQARFGGETSDAFFKLVADDYKLLEVDY